MSPVKITVGTVRSGGTALGLEILGIHPVGNHVDTGALARSAAASCASRSVVTTTQAAFSQTFRSYCLQTFALPVDKWPKTGICVNAAYCVHLSESTSTKSITIGIAPADSTYCAIAEQ